MEVFLLVLLVALIFYIKSSLDSKFEKVEDKIDQKFRELNGKIDLLKGTEKLPEKPIIAAEMPQPKVTPEVSKPSVIIEKTEPLVFTPIDKETVEEKIVFFNG